MRTGSIVKRFEERQELEDVLRYGGEFWPETLYHPEEGAEMPTFRDALRGLPVLADMADDRALYARVLEVEIIAASLSKRGLRMRNAAEVNNCLQRMYGEMDVKTGMEPLLEAPQPFAADIRPVAGDSEEVLFAKRAEHMVRGLPEDTLALLRAQKALDEAIAALGADSLDGALRAIAQEAAKASAARVEAAWDAELAKSRVWKRDAGGFWPPE